MYGAGNQKLGSIVKPSGSPQAQIKAGKKLRTKFLTNIPALSKLIDAVQHRAKTRGYLIGIDKRKLRIRSLHSALNTLLQSTGAIVVKKATNIMWDEFEAKGYRFGREIYQLAHVHDEYQLAVRKDLDPEEIGGIAVNAIRKAGEYFGFRCPLDGEYKTGDSWADTH